MFMFTYPGRLHILLSAATPPSPGDAISRDRPAGVIAGRGVQLQK